MTRNNLLTKLLLGSLLIPITLCVPQSHAGDIGFSIHFGTPYPPVVMAPQPIYRRPMPAFSFSATPEFIYSPSLNFYVGVGSPYDVFYHNNSYFIFDQGYWYRSSHLRGSWQIVDYHILPPGFRKHRIEQIRRYRDTDYRAYRNHRRESPDRRYPPHYSREHKEKDQKGYRDDRRPREYERDRKGYRDERRPREYDRDRR